MPHILCVCVCVCVCVHLVFSCQFWAKSGFWHKSYYLNLAAAAAAKSLQLCPTLCDPIDGSPPGSPVPGILQARTLEWVAVSFSNAWKWKVKVKSLSRVWLFATPWTAAYQAPPSMGFSRQEYWNGVPLPWTLGPSKVKENVNSQMLCGASGIFTMRITAWPLRCRWWATPASTSCLVTEPGKDRKSHYGAPSGPKFPW